MVRYRSTPLPRSSRPMTSIHTSLRSLLAGLVLTGAFLGAGCAGSGSRADSPGEEESEDKADKKDDEAEEALQLAHKLEMAKLELQLARLESEQDLESGERALAEARIEAEQ